MDSLLPGGGGRDATHGNNPIIQKMVGSVFDYYSGRGARGAEGETLMNGSARAPSPGYLSPESSSCYRSVAARTAAEELCLSCICVGIVLGLGHTKEEREIDR